MYFKDKNNGVVFFSSILDRSALRRLQSTIQLPVDPGNPLAGGLDGSLHVLEGVLALVNAHHPLSRHHLPRLSLSAKLCSTLQRFALWSRSDAVVHQREKESSGETHKCCSSRHPALRS